MANAYQKLQRLIRRGKLHEASVLFTDIMQQKVADRLAEEKKAVFVEASENPRKVRGKLSEGWWKVMLNGKMIDKVQDASNDAEEVKRSLVNHDGYDPDIKVVKESTGRSKKLVMTESVSYPKRIQDVPMGHWYNVVTFRTGRRDGYPGMSSEEDIIVSGTNKAEVNKIVGKLYWDHPMSDPNSFINSNASRKWPEARKRSGVEEAVMTEGKRFREEIAICPNCGEKYPYPTIVMAQHMGSDETPCCGDKIKRTGKMGTWEWDADESIATLVG